MPFDSCGAACFWNPQEGLQGPQLILLGLGKARVVSLQQLRQVPSLVQEAFCFRLPSQSLSTQDVTPKIKSFAAHTTTHISDTWLDACAVGTGEP